MLTRRHSMRARSGGFSLLEVLVAVFVLSIGVLGIVGLQVVSLQNNRAALFRSDAAQLASDIIDRIHANPGVNYAPVNLGAGPPAASDCVANACSGPQMATFDTAQWKCALGAYEDDGVCTGFGIEGTLPGGDGSITLNGTIYTIRVQWEDANNQCNQIAGSPELCFIEIRATL